MKRTWRRRNYFIKKELQGKYIFSFFIFVVLGGIIFTLIFSMLSANTLTIVYDNYNLQIGKTPFILLKEILSAHWIFIITAGLGVVIVSMFLTHRFAGPMYRFEKSLEEINAGNLNFHIRLRKKDEGKELAAMMNRLIDTLSSNIDEIRHLTGEIERSASEASQALSRSEQCREATAEIDKVQDSAKRIRDILSHFTTKNNA